MADKTVQITFNSDRCPECDHSPFNYCYEYFGYPAGDERHYCDDCHAELALVDVPMSFHKDWVVVMNCVQ